MTFCTIGTGARFSVTETHTLALGLQGVDICFMLSFHSSMLTITFDVIIDFYLLTPKHSGSKIETESYFIRTAT